MSIVEFMLWKFGAICFLSFIWGIIRRRRELRGEETDSEEED